MSKTGMNIQPCNIGSAEAHNMRDDKYMEKVNASPNKSYDTFADRQKYNRWWRNPMYDGLSLKDIRKEQEALYKEKVGQRMQSTAVPIREGACPIKPDTKIEDFDGFKDWFSGFGGNIIRIDLHFDEGHIDVRTGERVYNNHAHVIFDWQNKETGRSLKLSKVDMCVMQTVLAESLGMERGVPKSESHKDHLDHFQYREMKAAQTVRELQEEQKTLIAEISEIKTELNKNKAKNAISDLGAEITNNIKDFLGTGKTNELKRENADLRQQLNVKNANQENKIKKLQQTVTEYRKNFPEIVVYDKIKEKAKGFGLNNDQIVSLARGEVLHDVKVNLGTYKVTNCNVDPYMRRSIPQVEQTVIYPSKEVKLNSKDEILFDGILAQDMKWIAHSFVKEQNRTLQEKPNLTTKKSLSDAMNLDSLVESFCRKISQNNDDGQEHDGNDVKSTTEDVVEAVEAVYDTVTSVANFILSSCNDSGKEDDKFDADGNPKVKRKPKNSL